jgi:hypothetical protein
MTRPGTESPHQARALRGGLRIVEDRGACYHESVRLGRELNRASMRYT